MISRLDSSDNLFRDKEGEANLKQILTKNISRLDSSDNLLQ